MHFETLGDEQCHWDNDEEDWEHHVESVTPQVVSCSDYYLDVSHQDVGSTRDQGNNCARQEENLGWLLQVLDAHQGHVLDVAHCHQSVQHHWRYVCECEEGDHLLVYHWALLLSVLEVYSVQENYPREEQHNDEGHHEQSWKEGACLVWIQNCNCVKGIIEEAQQNW